MKTLKISNKHIIPCFEFNDLTTEVQTQVLSKQVDFEIDLMDKDSLYFPIAQEMERLGTPWFLGSEIYHKHRAELIDSININGYLFDEDGDMLNVIYHTNNAGEVLRMSYGKNQVPCEFI